MRTKKGLAPSSLSTWTLARRKKGLALLSAGVAFFCVVLAHGHASAAEFYVSPTGSDSNTGTLASPFATLQKANNSAAAGDTIWMRGGTYSTTGQITLSKSGTSDTNRTKIWAYQKEVPILDFSNYSLANSASDNPAITVTGSWMHLKGLEIGPAKVGASKSHSYSLLRTKGTSNNTFELLNIHHGFGPGLFIDDTKGGGGHLILNCDSHDNYDKDGSQGDGQNGDGFGVHYQSTGPSTIIRGCRAWGDADDGYDLISQEVPVTVENSWATGCGIGGGNGNGFKMGSSKTGIRHTVQNNVSWKNSASGFYANHSTGGNNWYNNTSYSNGTQFNLLASSFDASGNVTGTITLTGPKAHKLRNNIGFPNDNTNTGGADMANNTWDLGITPTASDFASISDTGCTGPREADGSLPSACTFMKLAAGSKMIDKGVNVGLPFAGTAPDLGAYEYGAATSGTGGTSGGTGGSTGSGGSPGIDAGPGTGGSARSGGSVVSGGSVGVGGSSGGHSGGSIVGSGGSSGRGGGSTGSGGVGTAGSSGGDGGAIGAGGSVTVATGGVETATGGIVGTGGASQDSGGSIAAATGGTPTGGVAGTGGSEATNPVGGSTAGTEADSGGCGCAVGSRSPRGGMAALLMVGALALLVRRRRR